MSQHISGGAMDLSGIVRGAEAPAPTTQDAASPAAQQAQVVDVPAVVFDATDATFEQVIQLSSVVPVVVDLWAEWCEPCKTLGPMLEKMTRAAEGRLVLAKVDVDKNPGLAEAFKAQSIPTVVALVAGQPVPLFQGAIPEAEIRQFFDQLLELATQQGLNSRVQAPDLEGPVEQAPAEPQTNPAHEAALDAVERGDYETAVAEYERVLVNAPKDEEARSALVQVKLLARLAGVNKNEVRQAAADDPADLEAQFSVADLDVSGGHVEDAFLRLLELFGVSSDDDRITVREHLVELFEVVGVTDPRVVAARAKLANLLF